MKKRDMLALLCAMPLVALAQAPSRPVTLLLGYPAGGSTDALARVLAVSLGKEIGQPVIVDNRPGASAMLAAGALSRANPDGQTLMLGASPTFTQTPHVQPEKTGEALVGLVPVAQLDLYANVLVVNPKLPIHTLAELVAYARKNPGVLTYGSSGIGSSNHLAAALLASTENIELTHVPYKGNAPAMVDVISGQISFLFDIVNTAAPQIRSGKVRAIAIASPKRNDVLPDVPTTSEAGVKGIDTTGWYGIFAPPRTPQPVVDYYAAALHRITTDPATMQKMHDLGYVVDYLPPAPFTARIRSDFTLWGKVVKDAKIQRQEY